MGATLHTEEHYINMEGVIPNSKVVILPSTNEGQDWRRELFLRPGDWIPWVTVTVVVGMIILGIIVFVLHLNEKVGCLFLHSLLGKVVDGAIFSRCRGKMNWREGEYRTTSILTPYERVTTGYLMYYLQQSNFLLHLCFPLRGSLWSVSASAYIL